MVNRMKKIIDGLLVIAVVILSFAVQVLLLRVGKWNIVKALPVLIMMSSFAVWGTYLYFTSPHWSNATFGGSLIADYTSPFISCLIALIIYILAKKSLDNKSLIT